MVRESEGGALKRRRRFDSDSDSDDADSHAGEGVEPWAEGGTDGAGGGLAPCAAAEDLAFMEAMGEVLPPLEQAPPAAPTEGPGGASCEEAVAGTSGSQVVATASPKTVDLAAILASRAGADGDQRQQQQQQQQQRHRIREARIRAHLHPLYSEADFSSEGAAVVRASHAAGSNLHEATRPFTSSIENVVEAKQAAGRLLEALHGRSPWPNRFGIRPGWRWDGVVRGNGVEAQLLRDVGGGGML